MFEAFTQELAIYRSKNMCIYIYECTQISLQNWVYLLVTDAAIF